MTFPAKLKLAAVMPQLMKYGANTRDLLAIPARRLLISPIRETLSL